MSADNWALCPVCKKNVDERNAAKQQKADESYGKVDPGTYLALLEDANSPEAYRNTLREDWELGVDQYGFFEVDYRCSCSECGFKYNYKHQEQTNE